MSNLFGSLSIAVRSLLAQQGALDTTANNLSNVNPSGHSRQLPILGEAPPLDTGQISIGNAVDSQGVQSIRDIILELLIDAETQQQNRLRSFVTSMNRVQSLFTETKGAGLRDAINRLFNSFQELSANPIHIPARQEVISAAQNLASAFHETGQQLRTIQERVDQEVRQTVEEIDSDTAQLASLNRPVASPQGDSERGGRLEHQRYSVLNRLSKLVDVVATDSGDGSLTVTTSNEVPLVAAAQSFALSTAVDADTGFLHIFSPGADVTSKFTGGQLAGLLEARDQGIPSAISGLDNLAEGIIHCVNIQNRKGRDLQGDRGGNFFQPVVQPSRGAKAGAAEGFATAITDPSRIAASADGTQGDNANALAMANIQKQAVVNGETATEFYSNLVCTVGNKVSSATDEQEAVGLVLMQLQNQRADVARVSWDEEAAKLIRYQRAYEAAAEVVAAINDITNEVIPTL
ncbi:MAG: flagellar hook-associated protein FlgK [Terriglobia bacterium]